MEGQTIYEGEIYEGPKRQTIQNKKVLFVTVDKRPRRVNHLFYACLTILTNGLFLPCWIGACFGVCPTLNN
jgi:hypothetical protein